MAIARKFGDEVYFWHVPDLQKAAEDLPVKQVDVNLFDFDIDAWFGEACEPTISNVVDHMSYIRNADLSNPIILSAQGHVFDGLHRLAKCLLEGISMLPAKQFTENPHPFKIQKFIDFQTERPRIAASLIKMEIGKL